MDYILNTLVFVGIYTTLAYSLDLTVGHAGLLSLAQPASYGVGAYTSALMAIHLGAPFAACAAAAMVSSALLSSLVALPSGRLRDDDFVAATLAFQMITFSLFNNSMAVTRGALGISILPQQTPLGWVPGSILQFAALSCALAAATGWLVARVAGSPFGRVLRAIREDEGFAQSIGKDTFRFKVMAFAMSGALSGAAGSLYAHYMTFIDPTSFTISESTLVMAMVIIGGAGSKWGPCLGALTLTTLPEALRFVGLPVDVAADLRQVTYGAALVGMMLSRPQGLVGRYAFGR